MPTRGAVAQCLVSVRLLTLCALLKQEKQRVTGWDIDARLLMYADALRRGADFLPGSASNPSPSGPPASRSHSSSPGPGRAAPSGGGTVSGSGCSGGEGSCGGGGGVAKSSGEGVGTASTDSRGGGGTVTQSCSARSKGDTGAGSSGVEEVDADKGTCTHAADGGAGGSDGVSGGCALARGAGAPSGMEPVENSSAASAGSTGAPADMAPAKRCSCSAAGEGHEPDLLQSVSPAAGTPCPGEAATTAAGKRLKAQDGAAPPAPTCGWAAEHGRGAATSGAAALAGRPDRGAPSSGHVAANGIAGPGTAWQTADARHAAAALRQPSARSLRCGARAGQRGWGSGRGRRWRGRRWRCARRRSAPRP